MPEDQVTKRKKSTNNSTSSETITVHTETFRTWLLRRTSSTPAPLEMYAQQAEAFQDWWKMLRAVFHVPDPSSFPIATYDDGEVDLLERFIHTARDLASMTVLSFDGGVTFNHTGEVERTLPPSDSIRGALVTLRQLDSPDEDASFSKVWKIVNRRLYDVDARGASRHRRYRLIQNKLLDGYLVKMADVQSCVLQEFDTKLAMSIYHAGRPRDVINEAMYTGHVHWNRKRASTGAMGRTKDEVLAASFEMDMFYAMMQLSHWKFVYAEFLEHQLDG
jgi:hypothetical protein